MAYNLVLRHLVFWTITCALFCASEIQAQSTLSPSRSSLYSSFLSTSSSSASLSVSPSSTSSMFLISPSQNQSSSSVFASQSTALIEQTDQSRVTTPATDPVDPTASEPSSTVKQSSSPSVTTTHWKWTSSTVKQSSSPSVTTTVTTTTASGPDLTETEYILIACLGVFAIVLIILVILAVQVARLNKTVNNLKFAPSS